MTLVRLVATVALLAFTVAFASACDVKCLRNSDCGRLGQCRSGLCTVSSSVDAGVTRPVFEDQSQDNGSTAPNNGAAGAANPSNNTAPAVEDAGTVSTQSSGILDASRQ